MKVRVEDIDNIKPFQKEKDKFYLLTLISMTEGSLLYSDLKTYILGRSEVGLPTWIWTDSNIDYELLKKDLNELMETGINKITCKKELYEKLKKDYKTNNYFEMGYLSCKRLIKPKELKGVFTRPSAKDEMIIASYFQQSHEETEHKKLSLNDALEDARLWIKGKRFFILVNEKGKIVSMAGYSQIGDVAKITHVYTPKEERRKSYCTNLIYELTKYLEDNDAKAILYTDYNYKASNEAYKKVGYEIEEVLINFEIEK